MNSIVLPSPAKLNLFLAITGRRSDGFHDLVSVVAPLDWADTLSVEPAAEFTLACNSPEVPVDETNLVLKAARAFNAATGRREGAHFKLEKRLPVGAGLGGGSSNAATALRALNTLAGEWLSKEQLMTVAAQVGSDCPLFLHDGPSVMRGRGDRVEPADSGLATRVSGRRVLVFKPDFGISTPWAYRQMVTLAPGSYLSKDAAEARLAAWLREPQAPVEALLFNNLETPAFRKYVALPTLLEQLRRTFGLEPRMSGSGSACFALLPSEMSVAGVAQITTLIREAWGPPALVVETRLA